MWKMEGEVEEEEEVGGGRVLPTRLHSMVVAVPPHGYSASSPLSALFADRIF